MYLVNNIFCRNFNFLELDDSPASCIIFIPRHEVFDESDVGRRPALRRRCWRIDGIDGGPLKVVAKPTYYENDYELPIVTLP